MLKKVVIATNSPFEERARDAAVDIIRDAGLEAVVFENYGSKQALIAGLQGASAVIVRSDKITQDVIDACSLELIVRAGAGYDTIDFPYAESKGIYVENTPGANAVDVAEEALALMLMHARYLHIGDTSTKAGEWLKEELTGKRLSEKKLGIQGLGYVGRALAQKASALGMNVFAYDIVPIDKEFAEKYRIIVVDSVEELYRDSDVVSLHFDENPKTKGIVNYDLLSLMKEDGILINCARAGIIDDDDLERILNERHRFRYGADLHPEGDKPGEKRFAKFGNRVLLLPHIGGSTEEANMDAATMAARQAVELLVNGVVRNAVNNPIPDYIRSYVDLAEMIGRLHMYFTGGAESVKVTCYSELGRYQRQLAPYVAKGLLSDILGKDATPAESMSLANMHGIKISFVEPDERKGYGNAIEVAYDGKSESHTLLGRIDDNEPQIRGIDGFNLTIPLEHGVYIFATYDEAVGMADRIEGVLTGKGFNKKRGAYNQSSDRKMAAWYAQIEQINGSPLDFKGIQDMVRGTILKIEGVRTAYAVDLR